MTEPDDNQERALRLQRKNWIMLVVLVGFAVSVTTYSAIHIRNEINMSAPAADAFAIEQ